MRVTGRRQHASGSRKAAAGTQGQDSKEAQIRWCCAAAVTTINAAAHTGAQPGPTAAALLHRRGDAAASESRAWRACVAG
jgi:hypothetical protein